MLNCRTGPGNERGFLCASEALRDCVIQVEVDGEVGKLTHHKKADSGGSKGSCRSDIEAKHIAGIVWPVMMEGK